MQFLHFPDIQWFSYVKQPEKYKSYTYVLPSVGDCEESKPHPCNFVDDNAITVFTPSGFDLSCSIDPYGKDEQYGQPLPEKMLISTPPGKKPGYTANNSGNGPPALWRIAYSQTGGNEPANR